MYHARCVRAMQLSAITPGGRGEYLITFRRTRSITFHRLAAGAAAEPVQRAVDHRARDQPALETIRGEKINQHEPDDNCQQALAGLRFWRFQTSVRRSRRMR